MKTEIKKINSESLSEAKTIIEQGGIVAMPTETVYGLGANAFNEDAVKKIFLVKGRPNDNPLIVHVHSDYDISTLIDEEQPYTKILRENFLPGPLTMVYPSTGKVSSAVSCGLNTLAIRVPSHSGAQEFLKFVHLPIAAPSANISKHVSPTSAQHVFADFNGKIPLILDGGICSGGIESTVLDVTGPIPMILREGLITQEMIANTVGDCKKYVLKDGEKAKSPGMMYKHYSPRCQTILLPCSEIEKAKIIYSEYNGQAVILCEDWVARQLSGYRILNLGTTEEEMAASLYARLREAENITDYLIAIEPRKKDGIMAGVMNRLSKACHS